jgi:hypothetical protein
LRMSCRRLAGVIGWQQALYGEDVPEKETG